MLEDYLSKVPEHVLSFAGKARMPRLRNELLQFVRNLRRESDNLRAL
jgi:hypothetical protein